MTERNWMGKNEPEIVKRRSPLSKFFDAKDWTVELIPRRLADVTLSWSGIATHKTTGEVREFGPYHNTKDADGYRAILEFCDGAFKGMKQINSGENEAKAQRREDLKRMIDAEELPTGLQGEALSLGLSLEPVAAAPTSSDGTDGPFSRTDNTVAAGWMQNAPQREFFLVLVEEKDPHYAGQRQRQAHNIQQLNNYLIAHQDEVLPLTLEALDRAYQVLLEMDCIHKSEYFHRGFGTLIGGRARDYSPDRDSSFKRQRTFTEDQLAAARRKLIMAGFPQLSTITKEQATKVLGDADLVEALAAEATRK